NGISKTGTGSLILSGANTFAGMTDIVEGVVNIRNPMALGSTAGDTKLHGGAQLALEAVDSTPSIRVVGESLLFMPDSIHHVGGDIRSVSGANSWTGPINLGVDVGPFLHLGVDLGPAGAVSTLELSGVISGAGGIDKIGAS